MAEFTQPSEIAREALRRLAMQRLAPTPDNYRALYHEIAGTSAGESFPERALKALAGALPRANPEQMRLARAVDAAVAQQDWKALGDALAAGMAELGRDGPNWPAAMKELATQIERRHAGLTQARKREALERVLSGSDPELIHQRLQGLFKAWSQGSSEASLDDAATSPAAQDAPASAVPPDSGVWPALRDMVASLLESGVAVLVSDDAHQAALAQKFAAEARTLGAAQARNYAARLKEFLFKLQWVAEDRTEIRASLLGLLQLVIRNIDEIVIDDRWLHGQIGVLTDLFAQPLEVRRLEDAERRIKEVIYKQSALKKNLVDAQERLKAMLAGFVDQLARMHNATGDYHAKVERCAARISQARDIGELSSVVEEVLRDTRAMQLSTERAHDDLGSLRSRVDEAEREIARLQDELAATSEMVRHDALTGALNRKGLEEAFEREIGRARRRATPLAIGLLDIDNFKKLNDAHGHQAGDDALVHLAAVVRESLRPQDTVARYGGEEFIILLPETTADDAVAALTRVQRELTRRYFLHNNDRILITFSAGTTVLGPEDTPERAIARADAAMYEAKRSGKNRVVVAP